MIIFKSQKIGNSGCVTGHCRCQSKKSARTALKSGAKEKKHGKVLTSSVIDGILAGFACKKALLSAQSKRCEWFAVWMTGPRLIL
jgi:hypothetical protein